MNKLLIVLLAVCLVSVHAHVKRDAPAAENTAPSFDLDELLKKGQDIINKFGSTIKEQAGNLKKATEDTLEDIKKKLEADSKGAATGS